MLQTRLWATAQVDAIWPTLSEGFSRAVMATGGDITAGDLWQGCRRGDSFLLVAHDETKVFGASIWRPETWQTGAKLRCLGLYGEEMPLWIEDMKSLATKIAKDCGATSLLAEGRDGWTRIFPKAKRLRILYEETL